MVKPKTTERDESTPEQSIPSQTLRSKLKTCAPEIQNFVAALEAENLKCVKKLAKLQTDDVTLDSWINILDENTDERCVHSLPPYMLLFLILLNNLNFPNLLIVFNVVDPYPS